MRGLEARSELLRQAAVEVGCCRKKLVARENRCGQCDFGGLKLRHVERDIPGPVRPSISAGKERKVSTINCFTKVKKAEDLKSSHWVG